MKPLVLIIRDGWGKSTQEEGNAILLANTPVEDMLLKEYPHSILLASGLAVGLPEGQMGSSETGHLNIGAGRVVYQDIVRISSAIEGGSFFANPVLLDAFKNAKENKVSVHIMGLCSEGGVHSSLDHLYALIKMAKENDVERLFLHAFTDGRDTSPTSSTKYLTEIQTKMQEIGTGEIATIMGRYYAMDRDNRWERTEVAYRGLTEGIGQKATDFKDAIEKSYKEGITDEFIKPIILTRNGNPIATIKDDDVVIFFNFRTDRPRQITRAFTDKSFDKFKVGVFPEFVTFAEYHKDFNCPVVFSTPEVKNNLGETLSINGLRQLRIAETEKYNHVTFFFNSGRGEPYPGEVRDYIPSPKVPTYDLKPEMSAFEITEKVIERIKSREFDCIILNYANPDMVGHTGVMKAAIKAIETVDECVGKVLTCVKEAGGTSLVTADHGNAEQMLYLDKRPFTAHTTNPVHFILADDRFKGRKLKDGSLQDIAPTMLCLLGIKKPKEMTGKNLIHPIRNLNSTK